MPGLLFVSQVALEAWAEQRKIDFEGDVMTLAAGDGRGRSYALDPAVLFLKVLNGERDPNQLVAKVKTLSRLKELGAEHLEDSVVLGEVAYQVQPGFLAEDRASGAAALQRPVAKGGGARLQASGDSPVGQVGERARAEALPRGLEEKRREAEALARYLLENLS
jgi:hypothetical protein